MKSINMNLGNKLREIRKKKNLKQTDIAELTDLNVKTIQRYEKGENIPEKFLHLFSNKLNLEEKELFELLKIYNVLDDTEKNKLLNHFEEIYKILGYTFSFKETIYNEQYEIIKDNNTQKTYISESEYFLIDYENLIINFFDSLIKNKILTLNETNQKEIDFLESKEYGEILKKYEEPLLNAFLDDFYMRTKVDKNFNKLSNISYYELKKLQQKEIEELKKKLLDKPKKK